MFNLDYNTKEDIKNIIKIGQKFLTIRTKILIAIGSGFGLLNLINHEPDTSKIYLDAKDPYEGKYSLLINNRESASLKYLNDSKACIEYSNNVDDIYKNIKEFNPNKKQTLLTVFYDINADATSNKKLNPIVTELFIRATKSNIPLFFITLRLFYCSKKYSTKFNTLFCYEKSKQKRTSTSCI